jgi:hypothetical protein
MEGVRWAEHAARMRVNAKAHSISVEKLEGKRKHLDYFGVDGEKVLK